MTRLTERETEEIRRAKRAVESDAQKQESRTRFADSTPTPEPTKDPALQVLMARHGRLAEIYRGILYNILLPAQRALLVRRTVKELRGLSDHLLWDIGHGFELRQVSITGWTVVIMSFACTGLFWAAALGKLGGGP